MDQNTSREIECTFSGQSLSIGRIFLACVTGEQMLMITGTPKNPRSGEPEYDNLFIPVVCGQCELFPFEDDCHKEKGRPARLHNNLFRGWVVFRAVQEWCGREVSYIPTLTDPLAVIGKCGVYNAVIDSVRMKTNAGGQQSLEILPHVDAGFFPIWTG